MARIVAFHLFTDVTSIYSSKNLVDLELKLNNELKVVSEWMASGRLAPSIIKTKFILFRSKKLKSYLSLHLTIINGTNMEQVSSVKCLGVTFDSNLNWKNHIDKLCVKLSKTVGIFTKLRSYDNTDILGMLYYLLIYPFQTYSLQAQALTYPSYLSAVIILQKQIVKIITYSSTFSHSESLFKSLNPLTFHDIIKLEILEILVFVYEWFHQMTPSYFNNHFNLISSVHSYPTCQPLNLNLFLNQANTTQYGIRSLQLTGASLWNALPVTTKQITSLYRFLKNIKSVMIDGDISFPP